MNLVLPFMYVLVTDVGLEFLASAYPLNHLLGRH